MAKITLNDVSSGYLSLSTYNANNTAIEAAIENTLSRDGTAPNMMGANIDMNSFKVRNLADGTNNQDAVTVAQLNGTVAIISATSIDSGAALDGYVLTADGAGNSAFEVIPTVAVSLAGLTDTDVTGMADNDLLYYNGSNWVDTAGLLKWDGAGYLSVEATGAASHAGFYAQSDDTAAYSYAGAWNTQSSNYVELQSHGDTAFGGGLGNRIQYGGDNLSVVNGHHTLLTFADAASNQSVDLNEGTALKILDPNDTDSVTHSHDGTDYNLVGVNTTNWNITGIATINVADAAIKRATLTDYGITSSSPSSSSGAITFDQTAGNAFQVTLTENITSITLSNPAASGTYSEIIIKFVQDSTGSWTVAGWPASVKWPGGTAPVITTTLTTGTDIISLKTWNAGTTWFGDFSQDYS